MNTKTQNELQDDEELPKEYRMARSRVMYIENKSGGLEGDARIGRVYFSKTGATLYYRGKKFRSLKGSGFKANYFELETGDEYWISGPRRDQDDRLYGGEKGTLPFFKEKIIGDRPRSQRQSDSG